jgi:hypothetical protein
LSSTASPTLCTMRSTDLYNNFFCTA